jgi:hypothetical protein
MAAPSLRRSTRLVPAINALPEDVLAGALAFLDAPSLVRCGGVCRGWRALLTEKPHTWEGALFELDPCAALGPAGVAAALDAGRSCLDIAHSLGDSRCGCCRRRGALYYARAAAVRVCDAECLPSPGAAASPLINRFFFCAPTSRARSTCPRTSSCSPRSPRVTRAACATSTRS